MLNSRFLLVFSNVQKAIDKDSILEKIFPSGWEPFVVQILAMVVLVLAFFIFFFNVFCFIKYFFFLGFNIII